MSAPIYDIAIVGGGIIGLSTAMALTSKNPRIRVVVLEKESQLAFHQTGHNSGTLHSGIYYRPGSLKARLCVQGAKALTAFCGQHGIPVEFCGKVVVAASPEEIHRLEELYRWGTANGVKGLQQIGPERLKEMEPYAAGIQALYVPRAGIIDYKQVAFQYAKLVEANGGILKTSTRVTQILLSSDGLRVETNQGEVTSRFAINCGGLQSDRIARKSRSPVPLRIVPFRGEYYEMVPEKRALVRGLIYPVPDPRLPFLGVHLSRTIDGRVEAGPNAVLALKREGYRKTDLDLADLWDTLSYPGFWKMTARFWKTGIEEMIRSLNKQAFVRSVQHLMPAVRPEDFLPARAGVRAQALDQSGALLDDFHLIQNGRTLHVLNAPSPAATASIAIGEFIADAALKQLVT